jgi:integrase
VAFKTVKEIQHWVPKRNAETIGISGTVGLVVRGQTSGSKTFYFRKQNLWTKIASTTNISLKDAREMAARISIAYAEGASKSQIDQAADVANGSPEMFATAVKNLCERPAQEVVIFDALMEVFLSIKEPTLAKGPSRNRDRSLYVHHFKDKFGQVPVRDIRRRALLEHFEAICAEKYDTGMKLRSLISQVMKRAITMEIVESNPVPESSDLPRRQTIRKPHGTIAPERLPKLWEHVQNSQAYGVTKSAILVGIVTALRSGNITKVRAKHLNLATGDWVIPAAQTKDDPYRAKNGEEFALRLPLRVRRKVIELLDIDPDHLHAEAYVFPSPSKKTVPISDTAIRKILKQFDPNLTFHGFRNAAKVWGRNEGIHDALMDDYVGHSLKGLDKSYRRQDTLEKRADIAVKLADYVLGPE